MAKKKRVGFDMRMAGEGFGIGQYIVELAKALLNLKSPDIEYVLFFDQTFSRPMYEQFRKLSPHCRLLSSRYYSLHEQTLLPVMLMRERLDLLHVPNFNAPIFYPGPFVITIHDLIHHHVPGIKKRNLLYRLAYRGGIRIAASRARRIIAVSQATAHDIQKMLKVAPKKIRVIYEGISDDFRQPVDPGPIAAIKAHYGIMQSYILSVGVWRRYKNLALLAAAVKELHQNHGLTDQLVLVGEADPHYPEIKHDVARYFEDDPDGLIITGKVSLEQLRALYAGAACFAAPSLFEGFGLPALEAQAAGVPVANSDIPAARELLGDTAIFFDPHNVTSCVDALQKLLSDAHVRAEYIRRGKSNAAKFRWEETARQTERTYRGVLGMV